MTTTALRTLVERQFEAVEEKNLEAVLAFFASDAVFADPHYPTPRMAGKEAIAEGLRWGFKGMKRFSFTIVNYFEEQNGQGAAVEVTTDHRLKIGMSVRIQQTFVIEMRDGLITRIQAYVPYGPGGIAGLILGLTRLMRRRPRRHRPSGST